MMNAVDARTLIPTNSGFILVESLLLVWVQDELVLVSAPKHLLKHYDIKFMLFIFSLSLSKIDYTLYTTLKGIRNPKIVSIQ